MENEKILTLKELRKKKKGKVTLAELRTIYRKYQQEYPFEIKDIISLLKIKENCGENIDHYFNRYINSKVPLYKLLHGEDNQKEIKDKIYGYLEFLIILFEDSTIYPILDDDMVDGNDNLMRLLNCNICLKIGHHNELSLLNKYAIYTYNQFFRSVINKSIYNIMGEESVTELLSMIIYFYKDIKLDLPWLIFEKCLEIKTKLKKNKSNFYTLYLVEEYRSTRNINESIFQIIFLSYNGNELALSDIYVSMNDLARGYRIQRNIDGDYIIPKVFSSKDEFKEFVQDSINKYLKFRYEKKENK